MTPSHLRQALLSHPQPSVRVLAMTQIEGLAWDDPAVEAERSRVLHHAPVVDILDAQFPAGYWMHPGLGISPHYRATVWQLLFLAQFGAPRTPAVERAFDLLWHDNVDTVGAFHLRKGPQGRSPALTGAMLWAVARLDLAAEDRWRPTWRWVAQEIAPLLTAREHDSEAATARTWLTRAAAAWQRRGQDVPDACSPGRLWRATDGALLSGALHFPLTHRLDRLAWMAAAVAAGCADEVPQPAVAGLWARRLPSGKWPLDHRPGPLWCDVGEMGAPNVWVTLRAIAVLSALDGTDDQEAGASAESPPRHR